MTESFDLQAWLSARRDEVNALLEARLPLPPPGEDPGRLTEAMRYSLLAPGKRLRPVLALGAAQAVGAALTDPVRLAAAAVELIHCYSLIHDDLPCMDDDDYRRGKPTSHKVFGEATAVLAGDALLTLSFEWLAEAAVGVAVLPHPGEERNPARAVALTRAAGALARGAGMWGMVRGQARDLGEPPPDDLDGLEQLHREKTGALFKSALEVGALAAGASPPQLSALEQYGECFGIAFQHADDLSDNDHPQLAEAARARARLLAQNAVEALGIFGDDATPLRALAQVLMLANGSADRS